MALVFLVAIVITLALVFPITYFSVVSGFDREVNGNLQDRAEAARRYFATNNGFSPQDLEAFGRVFGGVALTTPLPAGPSNPPPVKADFKTGTTELAASLVYLRVSFWNGQVWSVPDLEVMNRSDTQAQLRSLIPGSPGFSTLKLKSGELVRVYTVPVVVRGQTVAQVQAVRSMEEYDSLLKSLAVPFVLTAFLAVILLSLLGWLVTRRALAPIEKITEAAYRIGLNNDLTERIAIDSQSNNEVTRLALAFNSMLDRVEKNFRAQKQFIADSSHELRTPLTVIKGNLDLLKRNPDPQNQAESLRAIEREIARTQRLVEDLLLLAQADARQTFEVLPIQLDTIVLDVYMNTRVLADARHQSLKLGHFEPVTVMGDADRLKRVVLNLVDNAIKYTPEGGTVTVALYKGKRWARVEISDTGIGIAEKDQPLIFDRFYRVDKARSRASGSTGLGLSIVKYIVEAHGGRISVSSEPGQGSTFTVWLQHSNPDDSTLPDEDDFSDPDNPEESQPEETPAAPAPVSETNY